jgi:hypothetical protein
MSCVVGDGRQGADVLTARHMLTAREEDKEEDAVRMCMNETGDSCVYNVQVFGAAAYHSGLALLVSECRPRQAAMLLLNAAPRLRAVARRKRLLSAAAATVVPSARLQRRFAVLKPAAVRSQEGVALASAAPCTAASRCWAAVHSGLGVKQML